MYIINLKESITSPASQVLDFMGVSSSSAKLAHNLLQKNKFRTFLGIVVETAGRFCPISHWQYDNSVLFWSTGKEDV